MDPVFGFHYQIIFTDIWNVKHNIALAIGLNYYVIIHTSVLELIGLGAVFWSVKGVMGSQ